MVDMNSDDRARRRRQGDLDRAIDRRQSTQGGATQRFFGQVYSGGSFPSGEGQVYLMHPVEIDCGDAEGDSASLDVDTTRSVPVVVLNQAPQVGDVLPSFAVGGRWVSERTGSQGCTGCNVICGTCQVPRQDLTLEWTNLIIGNGSTTLSYAGSPTTQWTSACTNQLLFELVCTQNRVEFRVYYFLSGSCPTGQSQYCSTLRSNPNGLTQTGLTCSPFMMTVTLTSASCPSVSTYGYTSFKITGPAPPSGPVMCATFCVGCGGTGGVSVVSVYTPDCGTLLATGTVSAAGTMCVSLTWSGKPGPYCVTASSPGFDSTTEMIDVQCGQSYPVLLRCEAPDPLTLTDDAGTHSLARSSPGSDLWWCCFQFAGSTIVYRVILQGDSGVCRFSVVRSWGFSVTPNPEVPSYCMDSAADCPLANAMCNYQDDSYGFGINNGEGIHDGTCLPISCDLHLGAYFVQNPPPGTAAYFFFGPLGPSVVIDT